jgi:hypothetical protein
MSMRARVALTAALVSMLGLAAPALASNAGGAPTSGSHAAASSSATTRVVVRPVTKAGVHAAGFHVKKEQSSSVDCSFRDPSPGAVNRNIELCSPSAEYAIACWKSTRAHHVLCTRDPSSKRLYLIRRSGKFARTGPESKKDRAPLLLILRDGTRCSIRDGGAWGTIKSHPNWVGTYSCDHHGDVWSPAHAHHDGVNESHAAWTVHTASASGNGHVTVRAVRKAYFVGTRS